MLESLPDGIHSGLLKERAKGVFFYFQADDPDGAGKQHFWDYYDLKDDVIVDNRYVIANLIACQPDTPRVVGECDVFGLQGKVVQHILRSFEERQALEAAPRSIDPLQQTVATALQGYLNHPDVDRSAAVGVIRFLGQPLMRAQVKEIKAVYEEFQRTSGVGALIQSLTGLKDKYGLAEQTREANGRGRISREELRLICFDVVSS